jgi:hypothetical protein
MADEPLPSFDATDATAENNMRRDLERAAREDADVLRLVMRTKQGRAFIIRQLDRCHVNSPNKFVAGSPDITAHNLGFEAYGLLLLADVLAASTDLYMQAVKEAQDEERRKAETRRAEAKRREEAERPPTAEEQVASLPPPKGYPGHVPPPDLTKR